MRARGAVLCGVAVLIAAVAGRGSAAGKARHPDHVRQIATVSNMHALRVCLNVYYKEHGKYPQRLEEALPDCGDPKRDCVHDGWGRRIVFWHTIDSYVLASFGKDGLPDKMEDGGFDGDIVSIGEEWAKIPRDVDS